MLRSMKSVWVALVVASALVIAGCGDDGKGKSATGAQGVNPKSALPHKRAVVYMSDPVLPAYVTVIGLGDPEPWGRWSVSDRVVFKFGANLPNRFSLVVHARAYGPNAG